MTIPFGSATIASASRGLPAVVSVAHTRGLPSFGIFGCGDQPPTREVRDRIRAAILNSHLPWPDQRITVSVTWVDEPRLGRYTADLDFAVALGVLAATGAINGRGLGAVGPVGLDGTTNPPIEHPIGFVNATARALGTGFVATGAGGPIPERTTQHSRSINTRAFPSLRDAATFLGGRPATPAPPRQAVTPYSLAALAPQRGDRARICAHAAIRTWNALPGDPLTFADVTDGTAHDGFTCDHVGAMLPYFGLDGILDHNLVLDYAAAILRTREQGAA